MMKPNRRRGERPRATPGSGPKPAGPRGGRPGKPRPRPDRGAEAPRTKEHPQYGSQIPAEELEFMRQQAEERARERKNKAAGLRSSNTRPTGPRAYGSRPQGTGRYPSRDGGTRPPRHPGGTRATTGPSRYPGAPYRPAEAGARSDRPRHPRQSDRPPYARPTHSGPRTGARPSAGRTPHPRERYGEGAPALRPDRRPAKPFRTGVQSAGQGPPRPSPAPEEPPLARLLNVLNGFQESAALIAGHSLGFFPVIHKKPQVAADVARHCNTDPRGTEVLLNALAAIGVLHCHGGTFVLPREFAPYLVPGHAGDATGMVEWAPELYDAWGDLPRAIREGTPRIRLTSDALLTGDPARVRRYIRAVHTVSREAAERVTELAPLLPGSSLLDVGGGSGVFAAEYARRTPDLNATLFDLPPTLDVAREILQAEGYEERIRLHPGDYRTDPLPGPVDTVLLSNVLQTEGEENASALLRKVREATRPGGTLLVHGMMPDATNAPSMAAALFALRMYLVFDSGHAWSTEQVAEWLTREQFAVRAIRPLGNPFHSKLIIASRLE